MQDFENFEDIDVSKLKLEDLLLKPDSYFEIECGGETKSIFMSYYLLNALSALSQEDPVKWEMISIDEELRRKVLDLLLTKVDIKNQKKEIIVDRDYLLYEANPDISEELILWAQEHVKDFFTTRFFKTEKLKSNPIVRNQNAMMIHLSKNYLRKIESSEELKSKLNEISKTES
jgi:hypothetical protein